jgi:hypothetical protein
MSLKSTNTKERSTTVKLSKFNLQDSKKKGTNNERKIKVDEIQCFC